MRVYASEGVVDEEIQMRRRGERENFSKMTQIIAAKFDRFVGFNNNIEIPYDVILTKNIPGNPEET